MILIISSSNDNGVKKVCDWLNYYDQAYMVANENTRFEYRLRAGRIQVGLDGRPYSSITTGWIRNPHLGFGKIHLTGNEELQKWILMDLQKNQEFLFHHFKNELHFLGTPYSLDINKLRAFQSAADHGILVPPYRMVCQKSDLADFMREQGTLVTKSAGWNINVSAGRERRVGFTRLLTDSLVGSLPDSFLPSLLQQYIPADLEIRTVFIGERDFSMAQSQKIKTRPDIRQATGIDHFPCELPVTEANKIRLLMNSLDLDFCVFDILYAYNRYWLIDINPTGQFTDLSTRCHYPVENTIAQLLISRHGSAR